MKPGFTFKDLLQCLGTRVLEGGTLDPDKPLILSTDSRHLEGADIFLALRGERFDGHAFLPQALAAGITILVVEPEVPLPSLEAGRTVLEVPNTLRWYGDLAALVRSRFSGKVVTVSGSVGKTTTKELLGRMLGGRCKVHATSGNFNNLVGLPLTILSAPPEASLWVLELGTNQTGELPRLLSIAAPDISVLTTIGRAHLGMFADHAALAQEKMASLSRLPAKAKAVINLDNQVILSHLDQVTSPSLTFSCRPRSERPADINIERRSPGADGTLTVQVLFGKESHELTLENHGPGFLSDVLAAMTVARELGVTFPELAEALRRPFELPMRMQRIQGAAGRTILLDCYNSSPEAARNALWTFVELKQGQPGLAILGDMRELGNHAHDLHRELGLILAGLELQGCLAVGEYAEALVDGAAEGGFRGSLRSVTSLEEASAILPELVTGFQWVLLKASRSMRLEQLLPGLAPEYRLASSDHSHGHAGA